MAQLFFMCISAALVQDCSDSTAKALKLLQSSTKLETSYMTWAHFYWHGLTLIPACISNHMPSKVWDGITYPFLNFNGCTVEV